MTNQQYKEHLLQQREDLIEEIDHAVRYSKHYEASLLTAYLQDTEDLLIYVGEL